MTYFSEVSVSGYNDTPPSDDGTESTANQLFWSTIKSKLSDPLNTAFSDLNTAITNAFAKRFLNSLRTITANTTLSGDDEGKLVSVTSAVTIKMPEASVVGEGFMCVVKNAMSSGNVTVAPNDSGSDTVGGASSQTLGPGEMRCFVCDGASPGDFLKGPGFPEDVIGTNRVFTTGDIKSKLGSTVETGWLELNGDRLGDASVTGADQAAADNSDLFTFLWDLGQDYAPVLDVDANKQTFTVDTDADTLAITSHGYTAGDIVILTNSGGSLPGGLYERRPYYVVNENVNDFQVAETSGGDPVDITSSGSGTHSALGESKGASASADFDAGKTILMPNARGRTMIGRGTGPGLTARTLGEFGGNEGVAQTAAMVGPHYHHTSFADTSGGVSSEGALATSGDADQRVTIATLSGSSSTTEYVLNGIIAKVTFTTNQASSSTQIDATGHNLENADRVRLVSTGSLPTGLDDDTTYYVINKAVDSFELSLTEGGAAVTFSDDGSGTHSFVIQADGGLTSAAPVDEEGTPLSQQDIPTMPPFLAFLVMIKK